MREQGARFREILADVAFGKWEFLVHPSDAGFRRRDYRPPPPYLQVQATEPCVETGEMHTWRGRKWFLSPYMTRSEVVQTAFLAVMVAIEHETRATFTYQGEAIFSPHYNVDRLVELRATGTDVEDLRT